MEVKKMFFPVGGGAELEERIYGALLVSKFFKTHLEIMVSEADIKSAIPPLVAIPNEVLKRLESLQNEGVTEDTKIFQSCCEKLGIEISTTPMKNKATAHETLKIGTRSILVAQQSKFCDIVIAAAPPKGATTATFESAVTCSGKPVIVIPRTLKEFKADKILIGWNNSPESSRAVTEALPLLKEAKEVHIVSSKEYTTATLSRIKDLREYLSMHGIETTFELVKTTFIPGEALLRSAKEGNFDLIVAGAFGRKGLKERMLGGASGYLLKHTTIPAFVSH